MAASSKSRAQRPSSRGERPTASAKDLLGRLRGAKTHGSSLRSPLELVQLVREGMPYDAWERVAKTLAVSSADLSRALGISDRTLQRRKERDEALSPEESERLLRVIRVQAHAARVLGDDDAASEWLRAPNGALGGIKPLTLLDTDVGTSAVEDVLAQIEDGAAA